MGTRVARGSAALGLRQVAVWTVRLAATVLLARRLDPAVFGAFVVTSTVFTFFTMAADLGLAASLVRQKSAPTRDEVRSVFTAQLLLAAAVAGGLAVCGPVVAHEVGAPTGVDDLTRFVAVAVFIAILRSTPVAVLERELRFGALGLASTAESLAFNATAVGLAWHGFGVRSFGFAIVAQASVGLVLIGVFAGGLPTPTRRPHAVRSRISFGLYYFGSAVTGVLKDAISPLLVGVLLSARDVGLVEWAVTLAAYPLIAVMVLQRVFFPAFARVQHDRQRLARAVERVIHVTNLVTVPVAMITLVLAPFLVPLVFGERWTPALPVFYLLWLANIAVPSAAPLVGFLNAVGSARTVFWFGLYWMVSTWVLTALLVRHFDRLGFGLANVCVQLSAVLFIRAAQRHAPFRVVRVVWRSWAAAVATAVVLAVVVNVVPPKTLVLLAIEAVGAGALYAALVGWTQRSELRALIATFRGAPVVS